MILIVNMKDTETNLLITLTEETKNLLIQSAKTNKRPIKRQAEWFILQGLKKENK